MFIFVCPSLFAAVGWTMDLSTSLSLPPQSLVLLCYPVMSFASPIVSVETFFSCVIVKKVSCDLIDMQLEKAILFIVLAIMPSPPSMLRW